MKNPSFALTRHDPASEGSAILVNSFAGGSAAIFSAGTTSGSAADTSSASSAISETSSARAPETVSSA
jgi:hypothetical protein